MDEAFEDLRAFIAYRVREGFESAHDIVENASDYALERYKREDLRAVIKRVKYERVSRYPWLPIDPDPPSPDGVAPPS